MGQMESHHGVLRETRPSPLNQQMTTERNEQAYLWLYAALGFGGVVFFLILIGMWCQRNRGPDVNLSSNDSFLHTVDDKRDSSILDGSLTTSSVQPMSNFDKMSEYPPPSFCSSVLQSGKGMNFGSYNLHHQQPVSVPPPTSQQIQNDTLLQTLNERSDSGSTRRDSVSRANSLLHGRVDSFPYEEYGMPESERVPLRTRVEDQNPFNSYLHLTPSELHHLDSMDDSDSVDLPHSQAQTLPMSNTH